ncbi:uncharacterized protein GGS22DRAFT_187087 [Annulohypoxylon maeteangense]|uniref:uncharacterized protein n=1 Tax=Annulohypoxylon maeteangense TaxID=1927788 RepID=UPI00200886B1|nr:uncharacterized protein GGS22DRAFT_187087 [Annulohypoxylon maeteangense]KAI0887008.1 hypothetical protein GGS22DRAFT_187087 [Annulohypoxylon maeteangense]
MGWRLVGRHHNDKDKFGSEKYDILDEKIKVFKDYCRKAGVDVGQYHDAYSTMLKGRALQFYFDYLAEKGLSFEQMVIKCKEFFHTAENQQLYMTEWHGTNMHTVIEENPGKDLQTCLEILISFPVRQMTDVSLYLSLCLRWLNIHGTKGRQIHEMTHALEAQ